MPTAKRSRGIICREAHHSDLEDLDTIENEGAFEPVGIKQLTHWYERMDRPKQARGRRLWTSLQVISDQWGLILGYAALVGEDGLATVRVAIHPKFRGEKLGARVLTAALDDARVRHELTQAEAIISERQETALAFARAFGFRARDPKPVVRDWFGPYHDGYALVLPIVPCYEAS